MTWRTLHPYQKVDLVKEHWRRGYSAKDIAESIGARLGEDMTRQMIIGVYSRYAADLVKHPLHRPLGLIRKQKAPRCPEKRRFVNRTPPKPKPPPKLKVQKMAKSPVAAPQARYVPLMDLRPNECRWPVNEAAYGGAHLFCACRTDPGKPYCEYHAEMSVGDGTAAERRVFKVRRRVAA